ncbi:MAG: HNH endonuclease [Deltaproteobacteria bacterium]|nr:HNH endonuclease [Deltaproteobacteria bacterium]
MLLAAKLNDDNARELIDAACGKSKRDVEALLAARFPRPDVAPSIRRLPAPSRRVEAATPSLPMSSTPSVVPAVPARREDLGSRSLRGRPPRRRRAALRRAPQADRHHQQRHARPPRPARRAHEPPERRGALRRGLLDAALELLEAKLVKERFGVGAKPRKVEAPKKSARAFSKADRRAIVARDGLQCSHVDAATGVRCSETRWLTLDHVEPWAHGGESVAENGRVLCNAHNQAAARRVLGEELVRSRVAERRGGDVGGEGGVLPAKGRSRAVEMPAMPGAWTACGRPLRGPPTSPPTPLDNS